MGTSVGYKAPNTPEWTKVKRQVSRTASDGRPSPAVAEEVIRNYISAGGGSRAIAQGRGNVSTGGSAQRIAANVGGFLEAVGNRGIAQALREFGLESLAGRPIGELLDALFDQLGGEDTTIDDVDARAALSRLREELLGQADDIDELERVLSARAFGQALCDVLMRFFTFYLYEQFCRCFWERLVAKVGDAVAESYLVGILDFLGSALEERTIEQDIQRVDWSGEEGRVLTTDLLEHTLLVFGGE